MYKRILVPIDGTDTARAGLNEAIGLARQSKATIRLLNIVNDFPLMMEMSSAINFEEYREGLQQYGRKTLEEARSLVASAGLEVETQLEALKGGRVSNAILKDAKAAGCDLIVIGTHGRRGFRRALLGSDAEAVLRESTVPVLLIRSPDEAK
jgi:nucleotide-binding universal stress UspA family protein